MNKRVILVIISLLIITACDPSYKMEFPDLTEEKYNSLTLEERFEIYKNASLYIGNPPFLREDIAKEGEKVIPLILDYAQSSAPVDKKSRVIQLLMDVNKYFQLRNTEVEKFLLEKVKDSSDPNLRDYKFVLRIIRPEIENDMINPAFGDNPAIYTDDTSIIKYVKLVKENIMQETGIKAEELHNNFNIIGYVKEKKFVGKFPTQDIDDKTLAISFVAKVDWIEVRDYFEFAFLDDEGNEVSLEKIKQEVKVPFYFNVKKLKSRVEIEKIIAKINPKLEIMPQFQEQSFYGNYDGAIIDSFNKEILINVGGEINKAKNQCIAGTVNLLTGETKVENTACLIY